MKELARDQTSGLKRGTLSPSSKQETTEKSPYAQALETTGISRQTASRFQQMADIPEADFEAKLADPLSKPIDIGDDAYVSMAVKDVKYSGALGKRLSMRQAVAATLRGDFPEWYAESSASKLLLLLDHYDIPHDPA